MMTTPMRHEQDLAGSMDILYDAYYGIHSLRAAENFPISGRKLPSSLISHMARIKKACALANQNAGVLTPEVTQAICTACDEIIAGKLHDQFIVDPIQGGAGTSTNMNANEVIANRAIELLGGVKGNYAIVHPNDHVNASQSTNDVYPTAIRLALYETGLPLADALEGLIGAFDERSQAFSQTVTLGRTQLQDAVPIRFGQIFSAYSAVLRREKKRLLAACRQMLTVHLGGTAVGTCMNAPALYLDTVIPLLAQITGYPLQRSDDFVDATQNADSYVALSSALKSCGASLSKICNDLRLLSSGPVGGLGDITLPARQNGSSIMPGKVNPVIPEVVNQIAFRLIGFDVTVTMAAEAGQLELNAFEPVIFDSIHQGMTQLTQGILTLTRHCVSGIQVNQERCAQLVESSSSMATALVPDIGYTQACSIAKESQRSRLPVRQIVLSRGLLTPEEADRILQPLPMTFPCPG